MDMTVWIASSVVLAVAVGGGVFFYRRKSKEVMLMFEQISQTARQIPQQKKPGYILYMFKESIRASKTKKGSVPRKINDPRQIEAQVVQMNSILKDRSKVTDKSMKRALQTFDSYMDWEKKRTSKARKSA